MPKDRNLSTAIGCDTCYKDSNIVLFGAPFDGTTSFRPGARFGPEAIRRESWGLETYSPVQDRDLEDIAACDTGDLELPFGNTERALDMIQDTATSFLADGKLPLMLGGEHLCTFGAVRAAFAKYPDLHIIHFDAHADLREEYLGERLSHATVLRRAWDLLGDGRIFQFGIRSGCREELAWGKDHVQTTLHNFEGLEEVVSALGGKPIYFTLDLDVLDPSVFPGTGTPEPGGVPFAALQQAVLSLSGLNIVAADVNELSPPYDPSGISAAAACKILRELLLIL